MKAAERTRTKAFEEGADARARGQALADNPFCLNSEEHTEWAAGWRATFDLDEEDDPQSDRVKTDDEDI